MLFALKVKLKNAFKRFLWKRGYYIYPHFCIARDYDFAEAYAAYGPDAKFINVGGGTRFYHPRWDVYDVFGEALAKKVEYFHHYDLRRLRTEPFPEQNVDLFYTAHTFEHLPADSIAGVIQGIYDALKPGGVLRVVVPDADLVMEAYDTGDRSFSETYDSWFKSRGCENPTLEDYLLHDIAASRLPVYNEQLRHAQPLTPEQVRAKRAELDTEAFLDFLISGIDDSNFCGEDHMNWFNEKKLTGLLRNAGFKTVYRSAFGKSKVPVLREVPIFDETMPHFSLYLEAKK